ncbi:MAG: glycosyltransferase [Acidobacteria bacterium]|nr:glycosyltransferase [Acidobacteriota bacterium]
MTAPEVSVVMPAYNAAGFLAEAVESVLRQSFPDFELIVVDDGSTDGTASVAGAVRDSRVRCVSTPHGGASAARNHGVRLARGRYVAFLDSDDIWLDDKLSAQLAALRVRPAAGAAYGFVDSIDEQGGGRSLLMRQAENGDVYGALLVNYFLGCGSNLLVRKALLAEAGGFDESLEAAEDWDLCLRLSQRCDLVCVPKVVCLYRQRPGSLSSRLEVVERANRRVLEAAYRTAPAQWRSLRPRSLALLYRYLTRKAWAQFPTRLPAAVGYGLKYAFFSAAFELSQGGWRWRAGDLRQGSAR